MARIVAAEYVTLDGVMESPAWTQPYFGDEVAAYQQEALFGADALLLGRVTYEGFKDSWPQMNEDDFGRRMNSMPKHVATATLSTPEWNASFLTGDVVTAVRGLAEREQDLLMYGSAQLFESLRAADLIDEYRIMISPVVVGAGKRLFTDGAPSTLTVTGTRSTATGMVLLTLAR